MRTDNGLEATFQLSEVTASGHRLVFQGTVRMELPIPRQDERLPYEVEQAVEDAGQRFKRWVFCQLMEKLDTELVLASRQGKGGRGVVCRGRRSMTFKRVFGTVRVRRRRAEAVFAGDPQAARCLLPSPRESPPDEEASPPTLPEVEESGFEPLQGFPGAPGAEAIDPEQPRRVDPDTVMVQADEVVVHAQASTGMKQIKVYTAMVRTAVRSWYFAEENAQAVIYLVGALLAVLGVHQGRRRLLFVNDGARWIRDWFEALPVKAKTMILCWCHLAKRSLSCLYMACHGRKHRETVYAEVMSHLWEGRVDEAPAALARRREEMKCRVALKELVEYLQDRRPYLPDYRARREAGLWIASNRVEKLNDWAVSQRCKGLGMDWTREGVLALAVLESARRNGELPSWRRSRRLPVWVDKAPEAQAA